VIETYRPLVCEFGENCKSSRWLDSCGRGHKGHLIAPPSDQRTAHCLCLFLPISLFAIRQKSPFCYELRAHFVDLLPSTARQTCERNEDFTSACEPELPEEAKDLDDQ